MAMYFITQINDRITLEFDQNKDDRQPQKEYAHCHVYKNGKRVAQIRLSPYVDFSHGESNVSPDEAEAIIQYCEANRSMLEREYPL